MSADAMSPVPIPGLGGGRMTWAGRLSAADPGLGRLRLGVLGTVTAAAALGAEALLAWGTGALQVPYPPGGAPTRVLAGVAAQHHLVLVLAMLIGAVFAMLSTIAVTGTGTFHLESALKETSQHEPEPRRNRQPRPDPHRGRRRHQRHARPARGPRPRRPRRIPEEIAAAITYLASDHASFIHGAVLAVDGGRTAA